VEETQSKVMQGEIKTGQSNARQRQGYGKDKEGQRQGKCKVMQRHVG